MIKLILKKIKREANKIFGSKIDELYWKFRHFFDRNWAKSYISEKSINHPHRKILIEKISNYSSFERVLEIGCASGPNLYLLAKKFSKTKFYGIDVNKNAIKTGRKFFKKENINNVFLKVGNVRNLRVFKDKSVDVVFTDAVLIYEGPEKIKGILKEMLRVTKKAIILCEQASNDLPFYKDHWFHNYKKIFSQLLPTVQVKTTKISKEIWSGDWEKFGYIIEIIF